MQDPNRLEDIYNAAVSKTTGVRAEVVQAMCDGDQGLQAEVESLLRWDERSSRALAPGVRLGPYEVLERAGAGGMGEVYRARDTRLGRIVALKVVPASLTGDPAARARLEREAKAASALNHPHICTLHDIGQEGDIDYLVMEYLEGETLAERIARGPLPISDVVRYGAEIADALAAAHRVGVLHRDVKPGNVMLTKSGAKLLDFGIAKPLCEPAGNSLTGRAVLLGTPSYMAPEQIRCEQMDHRADIFSFGAVLYEMTTGRRAFVGQPGRVMADVLDQAPELPSTLNPQTPRALERLIVACLAKVPDARPREIGQIADCLRSLRRLPRKRPSSRRKTLSTLTAAMMILLTTGLWPTTQVNVRVLALTSDGSWKSVMTAAVIDGRVYYSRAGGSNEVGVDLWSVSKEGGASRREMKPCHSGADSAFILGVSYAARQMLVLCASASAVHADLWLTTFDGGDARPLGSYQLYRETVSMSPDATYLLFGRIGGLFLRPVRGGAGKATGSRTFHVCSADVLASLKTAGRFRAVGGEPEHGVGDRLST